MILKILYFEFLLSIMPYIPSEELLRSKNLFENHFYAYVVFHHVRIQKCIFFTVVGYLDFFQFFIMISNAIINSFYLNQLACHILHF